jgi:hypothetical protein
MKTKFHIFGWHGTLPAHTINQLNASFSVVSTDAMWEFIGTWDDLVSRIGQTKFIAIKCEDGWGISITQRSNFNMG